MLYLVGLGLGDAADITVKGLQAVKRCSRVYLEAYTSILTVGKEALEEYYGKELILADRDLVEQGADEILKGADVTDVAFLVVGDPFGATTHSDLVLRAVNAGIPYKVIHNASIMNAVGCCGLQREEDLRASSLHDGQSGCRSADSDHPEEERGGGGASDKSQSAVLRPASLPTPGVTEDTVCVGVARLGADDQVICTATLQQLVSCDLGGPLHSLVVTGRLHPLEVDMLRMNAKPNALQHLRMVDSSTYCS
ncbi:diphthine methyl ester synthase isoform X2 [Siniperca chuatsi]|uniref:diphthine methyl ester synthase isoform X2 n=1 Tax=Siniperca chuatsi TaxID=119488 RepID=UPI001CE0A87B|nr:diphthine methyl ester synthase isoform X2 [Siniperca chuatsi]